MTNKLCPGDVGITSYKGLILRRAHGERAFSNGNGDTYVEHTTKDV